MDTTQAIEDLDLVDLHVTGRKRENNKGSKKSHGGEQTTRPLQLNISISKSTPLSGLWDKFAEAGLELPDYIACNGKNWYKHSTKAQANSFEEIEVVQDRSSEPGKCIHINDSLISYANLQYGRPLELNIAKDATNAYMSSMDSLKDSGGLEIMFHRTIRMPDDDKIHQLPGSLGIFPNYNVAAYAEALPDHIVHDGGVFMPMWQREALWVSLKASHFAPYALRFSVGRINAVSGLQMDQIPGKLDGKQLQDYVVVPGQEWIDGICVAPGIVRQFVAMPLGSGYSVEGQKTGEEKYGGLQVEIIPSFQKSLRTWLRAADCSPDADELTKALRSNALDEYKTPSELELAVGTIVRSFPPTPFPRRDCVVSDFLEKDGSISQVKLMYHRELGSNRSNHSSRSSKWASLFSGRRDGTSRREDSGWGPTGDIKGLIGCVDSSHRCEDCSVPKLSKFSLHVPSRAMEIDERFRSSEMSATSSNLVSGLSGDPAIESGRVGLGQPTDCKSTTIPRISTRDLKAMGLAAGGKLVQDIYRDHNPDRVWNTAAARIVNVHILDPTSCEAVTHIVPPAPPVDAMGYAEGGGQFFVIEEQPESRLNGGNFENVKSVSAMDKEKTVPAEPALDLATPMQCRCGIRMCDCVVRPCGHVFCNVCIREIDSSARNGGFLKVHASDKKWKCLTCEDEISWVAGFAAPMNLPGEEGLRVRVPVNVLKVEDGRVAFRSVQKARI